MRAIIISGGTVYAITPPSFDGLRLRAVIFSGVTVYAIIPTIF
ncbi:MAG: hypothetical protein SOR74_12525 [Candidatus Faecivicinus sp.]|nr:hypothetical protein [Candidatus Faecivicinus sp.]